MLKTLRISFSLKNTYRVNGIIHSLKHTPLIKKLIPDMWYSVVGLKYFAYAVAGLWEFLSAFLGKLTYIFLMIFLPAFLYESMDARQVFLHIFVCLMVIGSYANTYLFNPSNDKYYALILMRMNAKEYALVNYGYSILKVLIGFLIFGFIFGLQMGLTWWQCILLATATAGIKLSMAAIFLLGYEKTGVGMSENKIGVPGWGGIFVLLLAAYGLPAFGIAIPLQITVGMMAFFTVTGLLSVYKIIRFSNYREVYHQILIEYQNALHTAKDAVKEQNKKRISVDADIVSNKKGFEYMNDLFVKRHRKILWKSSKKIAAVSAMFIVALVVACFIEEEAKSVINEMMLTWLPYFVFIMYYMNRGAIFANTVFVNCDSSMLTYPFYKKPKLVLELFWIRLRELVKINLLPAVVIGCGMALMLWVSGGTDTYMNYVILVVSIIAMSIFFSVHYLTIYYLFQPYNLNAEVKNGAYHIIMGVTYFCVYLFINLKMSTFIFGIMTIVFCILYCIIAGILVYRFAPKTFRLRS